MVERKQVEKDVALILKEAGFKLKAGQFEFNLGDWLTMNYCSFVRTPIKFLQALPDISSQYGIGQLPRVRLMLQTNVSLPQESHSKWWLVVVHDFRFSWNRSFICCED